MIDHEQRSSSSSEARIHLTPAFVHHALTPSFPQISDQVADKGGSNPCSLYFLNVLVDTTIGTSALSTHHPNTHISQACSCFISRSRALPRRAFSSGAARASSRAYTAIRPAYDCTSSFSPSCSLLTEFSQLATTTRHLPRLAPAHENICPRTFRPRAG